VLFLPLAWSFNIAITNSRFNARPVVYILYIKKTLDDNIYKHGSWDR
jgi:hypothetical protein